MRRGVRPLRHTRRLVRKSVLVTTRVPRILLVPSVVAPREKLPAATSASEWDVGGRTGILRRWPSEPPSANRWRRFLHHGVMISRDKRKLAWPHLALTFHGTHSPNHTAYTDLDKIQNTLIKSH